MINSKNTKIIKELVISALLQATGNVKKYIEIKPNVEKAFDIVIEEMKNGQI